VSQVGELDELLAVHLGLRHACMMPTVERFRRRWLAGRLAGYEPGAGAVSAATSRGAS
jgi:hypothetical protein